MIKRFAISCLFSLMAMTPVLSQRCPAKMSEEQSETFERWMKEKLSLVTTEDTREDPYRIPVVVHVVHNGESLGTGTNISDQQIASQLISLNQDFNRLNADTINTPDIFKEVAGNPGIEFVLASVDPDGNPSTGITRTMGQLEKYGLGDRVTEDEKLLKSTIDWPPENYLNVWVVDLTNDMVGHARFPLVDEILGLIPPYDRELDGVVIDYKAFGSNAIYNHLDLYSKYTLGRTLTHEIGHYLGVLHTFGDRSCSYTDFCEDTPTQYYFSKDCQNTDSVSCGSRDMFENFMDYTYDACMNLFTKDQVNRMKVVLEFNERRKSLLSSPALAPPDPESRITALENEINDRLRIYPNPAYGRLVTISSSLEGELTVMILDINGRITAQTVGRKEFDIDLKGLAKGMYVVKIVNKSEAYQRRLFIR